MDYPTITPIILYNYSINTNTKRAFLARGKPFLEVTVVQLRVLLATVVLAFLFAGSLLVGQYSSAKKSSYETLDLKVDVFEGQFLSQIEGLAYN